MNINQILKEKTNQPQEDLTGEYAFIYQTKFYGTMGRTRTTTKNGITDFLETCNTVWDRVKPQLSTDEAHILIIVDLKTNIETWLTNKQLHEIIKELDPDKDIRRRDSYYWDKGWRK